MKSKHNVYSMVSNWKCRWIDRQRMNPLVYIGHSIDFQLHRSKLHSMISRKGRWTTIDGFVRNRRSACHSLSRFHFRRQYTLYAPPLSPQTPILTPEVRQQLIWHGTLWSFLERETLGEILAVSYRLAEDESWLKTSQLSRPVKAGVHALILGPVNLSIARAFGLETTNITTL